MNRDKEVEIYHNAINLYGSGIQTITVIEELNELILAIEKYRKNKKTGNIEEETADVEIMINQLCIMNDIELMERECKEEICLERLFDDIIISCTKLVQAITKGIRGIKINIKPYIEDTWNRIMYLEAINGVETNKWKEYKLERLNKMVCM